MREKGMSFALDFKHSKRKVNVLLETLETKITEFLEYYGTPALMGDDFYPIIGEGDGETKFNRLLKASGHCDDASGFFQELLPQLTSSNKKEKMVGNIVIPHLLLVSLLEVIIPDKGFVSIKDVDSLEKMTNMNIPKRDRTDLQKVIDMYPVRLSWHTVRQMMVSEGVAYQYLPFLAELDKAGHANTWIGQFHKGLLEQMYQNRVIFLLNMSCPVYCRFCFRKHKESRNESNPSVEDIQEAVDYVRDTPTVKEIVITGGDPFLSRINLEATIDGLMTVDHVQTLRLATRSVAYYPDLFLKNDDEYLKYLKQKNLELQQNGKSMEIATHFIHPDEISPQSLGIISELVRNGIAVYIQTPLLKDCNDQGPVMRRLLALLRGAGAELHYIYIPCSPIHGNTVYWTPLSSGIDIAEHLRAHLTDRAVPKICTATPIGKMEWYTSGWAVEPVEGEDNFIWIRTPYTPDYFKSFAPLASELPNIRVNDEGTLDIQYMAKIGNDSYFLGSRPLRISPPNLPVEKPDCLKVENIKDLLKGRSIVKTDCPTLVRLHETRVEIDVNAEEADIDYIRTHERITDVVVSSRKKDTIDYLSSVEKIIKILRAIPHVNAVRLRSLKFNYAPEVFTPTLVTRLGEFNHVTVARPLRLEIETWFINADEIKSQHQKLNRQLKNKGITVYSNTPLLGQINDSPDEMYNLTYAYRKAGIEFHHLYVTGLKIQKDWNEKHPIDMYDVIDIASKIRRDGSGREGPRYIIQTPFGEVYYGLTCSFFHEDDKILIKLDSYTLSYFKRLDPDFQLPEGVSLDSDNKPIIQIPGLKSSTDFPL